MVDRAPCLTIDQYVTIGARISEPAWTSSRDPEILYGQQHRLQPPASTVIARLRSGEKLRLGRLAYLVVDPRTAATLEGSDQAGSKERVEMQE